MGWLESFSAQLFAYALGVGYYWLAIMGVVFLMAGDLSNWVAPSFKDWLNRKIPRGPRRAVEVSLMIIVIFLAGFSAWRDQVVITQGVDAQRQSELAKKNWWAGVAEARRQQIDGSAGLQKQLAGQNAKIAGLQQQLAIAQSKPPKIVYVQPPKTRAAPQRDPDTIYQLGDAVATVIGARIDRGNGIATFEQIFGRGNLNVKSDFEYRDYVLHFVSMQKSSDVGMAGQSYTNFVGVTCKIVSKH